MNVRLSDELRAELPRLPVTVSSSRVIVPNPRRPVGSIDITLGSPEDALAGWTNRSFIEMLNMPDADEPEGKQTESVTRGRPIIPMQWNVSSEEVPVVPVLPPAAAKADTWKPTVLVVDDSSMNRKMLVRMLISKGFACREAEDGVQALSDIASMGLKRLSRKLGNRIHSNRQMLSQPTATERGPNQLTHTATAAQGWSVILPASSSRLSHHINTCSP